MLIHPDVFNFSDIFFLPQSNKTNKVLIIFNKISQDHKQHKCQQFDMDDQYDYKLNNNRYQASPSTQLKHKLKQSVKESKIINNKNRLNQGIQTLQSTRYAVFINQIEYYQNLFCSKCTIQSLRKKTQDLEIQQVCSTAGKKRYNQAQYNRKIEQMDKLHSKIQYQKALFLNIKQRDTQKYNNISQLLFFLNKLKQQVGSSSVEDYSQRTCNAIFQSQNKNIILLHTLLLKIYSRIEKQKQSKNPQQREKINKIIREVLNLPRFLISKEKIQKLVNDSQLQRNFEFLIFNNCLGHYSNEANKKMPTQQNISLLKKMFGIYGQNVEYAKEIFKAICAINHGNKYRKEKGQQQYNMLYETSLEDLKILQKKTYENIKMKKKNLKKEQNVSNKGKISRNRANIKKKIDQDNQSEEQRQSSISDPQHYDMCQYYGEEKNQSYTPKRKWSEQKKIEVRKLIKPNQDISLHFSPTAKIIESIFIIEPRKMGQLDQKYKEYQS